MKVLIFTIFCGVSVITGYSQDIDLLLQKGVDLNKAGSYDSAKFYFQSVVQKTEPKQPQHYKAYKYLATSLLKESSLKEAWTTIETMGSLVPDDDESLIQYLLLKGRIASKIDKDKGLVWLDSAISLQPKPQQLAVAYLRKGVVQVLRRNLEEAQFCYDTAMQISISYELDTLTRTGLMELSGRIKLNTGDFAGALKEYQRSLSIKKVLYGDFHPEIGALTGNLGIIYRNLLQYDQALEYYGYSLEFRRRYLGEGHIEVANLYNNIGYVYYLKDQFDEAMKYHQMSYKIYIEKLPPNHGLILGAIEHMGLCHGGKREFDKADEKFNLILEARKKRFGPDHHWVGYAFYNLGAVAVEKKDYVKAANYFLEAISIGKKAYETYNNDQADNYNRFANCLILQGKFEQAARNFHLAIQSNTPGYKWNNNLEFIPEEFHYLSFREILRSYIGLAYSASGMKNFDLATEYLSNAEQYIYDFKLSVKNDKDLVSVSSSYKLLADCGIAVYLKQFESSPLQEYQREVFRFTELAKASTLLTHLNEEKAKKIADIPDRKLKRELKYQNAKDSLTNKVLELTRKNIVDESLKDTKTALFTANRSYELFLDSLESEFPKYANKKYGRNSASISSVQQFLKKNDRPTAVISYNLSIKNELTISVVTADSFSISSKNKEELVDQISSFRSSLELQESNQFESSSKELYQTLVKPIQPLLENTERLIVIPDGIIGYIPLETLLDLDNKYLLEKYSISYEPSATLLINREPKNQITEKKLLAYAPEFKKQLLASNEAYNIPGLRSESMGELPGAKKEVSAISDYFESSTLLGNKATEAHFKTEAPNYDILHFATHSVVNEKNADYTRLYFHTESATDTSSTEDGFLHAFELGNLELNARLVTLSACNTGFGKVEHGEGVMSLARSFAATGVPSVVMSLWPASDKSTPILMESFYSNLSKGMKKDEALSEARRSYLKNATGKAKHPFYWGGFVLIGDTEPLQKRSNSWMWFMFFGLISILAVGYFFRRS